MPRNKHHCCQSKLLSSRCDLIEKCCMGNQEKLELKSTGLPLLDLGYISEMTVWSVKIKFKSSSNSKYKKLQPKKSNMTTPNVKNVVTFTMTFCSSRAALIKLDTSDLAPNLTQESRGQPKCNGKVCCCGPWAVWAKTWLVCYKHRDINTELFWNLGREMGPLEDLNKLNNFLSSDWVATILEK